MRLLVDTSVWIDHFHHADQGLQSALQSGQVWTHAVVIGELAAGRLIRRDETITLLRRLPLADDIDLTEGLHLIAEHNLAGRGLSWSDIQLLAAAKIDQCHLWTRDRALASVAASMSLAWKP